MRIGIYGFVFGLIILVSGCLDNFEFEREDLDTSIVVDGQLTTSDGPHTVRISNVLAFGDKFFDPVPGLIVRLHHNDDIYNFVEESPGIHIIPKGIITGIPGETYNISLITPDGDTILSRPEVMPKKYEIGEVNAFFKRERIIDKNGIERRDRIVEVSINADFPEIADGEAFYLRYNVEEDYSYPEQSCGGLHQPKTCYINIPAFSKDFSLFNSTLSSKTSIDSLLILRKGELTNTLFRGLHYFSVSQRSITEQAYEYWSRVLEVTNQEGTVFDKPPAAVPGNLQNISDPKELILGYFELAAVDIKRAKIFPHEYFDESIDNDECSFFSRTRWPNRCCQCLNIKDATTIRPPWF